MTENDDHTFGALTLPSSIKFHEDFNVPKLPSLKPQDPADPLSTAVKENERPAPAQETSAVSAAQNAALAKNKLAQEALVTNPSAMRSQFPKLMEDMQRTFPTIEFHGNLDLNQIDNGLKDNTLSQDDKNLLSVFKAGYNVLSESPNSKLDDNNHPGSNAYGISAASLAMIDKAVNRSINEDPYFSAHALHDSFKNAAYLAAGAFTLKYAYRSNATAALGAAAFGATVGAAFGLMEPLVFKFDGGETEMYDHVKDDYVAFSNVFDQAPPADINAKPAP